MTQALEQRTYSREEYLEFELASEERHEYVNGEIRLMTGGTPDHNEIVSNLLVALKLQLKEEPYRIFVTDQRLWIPDRNLYTYPDIMVVEKPLQLQTGRTDTVINPCFIAECYPNQPKIIITAKNSLLTGLLTASASISSSISTAFMWNTM